MHKITGLYVSLGLFLFILLTPPVCAGAQVSGDGGRTSPDESRFAKIIEKWGVEPLSLRLTGAGHFLDFRYRVTDAQKARPVLDRTKKAYLIDEKKGRALTVPVTKLGPMRVSTLKPKQGKIYFILFSNSDRTLEKGDTVTVVVEDFRAEGLTVQ